MVRPDLCVQAIAALRTLRTRGSEAARRRPDPAQSAIARFSRTLASRSQRAYPLVEALDSVASATGSPVYNDGQSASAKMSQSATVQLAMRQTNVFPNMVVQMVAIGESPARWTRCCSKVFEFYEQESTTPWMHYPAARAIHHGHRHVGRRPRRRYMYLPIFKLAAVVGWHPIELIRN